MAPSLRLDFGGTYVYLSTTDMHLMHYTPTVGDSGKDLSESADVLFLTGHAAARVAIATMNRWFELARRYQQTHVGSRVYIEYRPLSTDSDYYRSEIRDGRVILDDKTTGQRLSLGYPKGYLAARVSWTRVGYWEGPETQIPLTNRNGSRNTAGLTVYNHCDAGAGHDNFVDMAAADILGDLSTPVKFILLNNYAGITWATQVYLAHNVYSTPADLNHILEAEAATGGTPTANAGCSGGYYNTITWATSVDQLLLSWAISATQLGYCAGNYFRMLMRLKDAETHNDMWFKVKITAASITYWEGEWVLAQSGATIIELATVRLPPFVTTGQVAGLTLELHAKHTGGGSVTQDIDFIQVSPMDGWRALFPPSVYYGTTHSSYIVDNMIDGELFLYDAALGGEVFCYFTSGAPIMAVPGHDQRTYILHDSNVGGAAIDRTLSIQAYYRPRRSSL